MPVTYFLSKAVFEELEVELPWRLKEADAATLCARLWNNGFHLYELTFTPRSVRAKRRVTLDDAGKPVLKAEAFKEAVLACFEGKHTPIEVREDGVHLG